MGAFLEAYRMKNEKEGIKGDFLRSLQGEEWEVLKWGFTRGLHDEE